MSEPETITPPLDPPDPRRCQHEHKPGSFMTLGPRSWVRCDAAPAAIVVEIEPGKDGQLGAMSLCDEHLADFECLEPDSFARCLVILLKKYDEKGVSQ